METMVEKDKELTLEEELTRRIEHIRTFTTSSYSDIGDLAKLLEERAIPFVQEHIKTTEDGVPVDDTPDLALRIKELVMQAQDLLANPPAQIQCPSLPPEELKKFIVDFLDGKIFSSVHVAPDDVEGLRSAFMVVALGGTGNIYPGSIALIYEYLARAMPTGINGNPCFMSCRFMNHEDWFKAREILKKEEQRRRDRDADIDAELGLKDKP